MELAGEFLGIDTDTHIYSFFRHYHRKEFPALGEVCRTSFARQAANLWRVAQLLHERLICRLPLFEPLHEEPLWLVDSFPLQVCKFVRAKGSKLFKGIAAYGYDHLIRNTFFGFRVHVRCSNHGAVAQIQLTAANVSDSQAVADLSPPHGGLAIGDRAYWAPERQADLLTRHGLHLMAPFHQKSKDERPKYSALLTRLRRRIETVIGQLAERFTCKRTYARDLWHLCHRITRKILSYVTAVILNQNAGNPPLQLASLIDL
jgi:hypothetical protein